MHGGDSRDSSTNIDKIFDLNHDSDGEGHSGGDNVEVGSALSLGISESSTQSPKILVEGNNVNLHKLLEA